MGHSTRWIRGTLWALAALLLAWALAWLAVPPLAKWQLQQQLGEKIGRSVTVGRVGFEPWVLRLTVDDLAIAGAPESPDAAPQLSIARLQVDLDARSLLRLAPVVESLQIDAPRLRLARTGDGRYDIDDVVARIGPAAGDAPGDPARFALYNLTLTDGAFTFDDRPAQRRHTISGLTLALPFVSNLPSLVDVKVEPRLAFTLDGARYESNAEALPFGPGRSGALKLRVTGLDIAPYRSYLPDTLPVRVERGRIDADLAFAFAAPQDGVVTLAVSGQVGLADFTLAERAGTPLLEFSRLTLGLKDVQPLARKVALGTLHLVGLQVHLDRDARGVLGLQRLLAADGGVAGAAAAPADATTAPAWQASLDALEIAGARVLWNDAAVQPASAWVLDGIEASAQQLRWPASAPMPFSLQATLRPQSDASATLAALSLQGQATDAVASARIGISALSIAAVAPYANAAQRVRVSGTGAAEGEVEWAARSDTDPMRLVLRLDELAIDGLRLGEPQSARATVRGDTLAAQRVQVSKVALDLATQSVVVGSARLKRPEVRLERGADGAWNVMRLAGPTALSESERPLVRAAAEATWQVRLDELAIEGGRIDLVDARPAPEYAAAPVHLGVEALTLGLRDLQLRGERLVSTPQLAMSARIVDQAPGRAREQPGRVEWRGRFGLEPMLLAGKAKIERLPVDAVQAYFAHPLGLRLERAEAGFEGEVTLRQDAAAGPKLDLGGDVLLSDLRVVAVDRSGKAAPDAADRELLNWQSLAVKGLAVAVRPGTLPKVVVREASLSDFFARLVLTQEGELNLNTVRPRPAPLAAPGGASAPGLAPVLAPAPVAAAASAPIAPSTAPFAGTRLPLELELGGLRLVNGRVDFSDRFVQPNYSAALTDLNGDIGAFRSGLGEAATLRLSGRVAGTGLLEIEGSVKPNSVPRELDVRAKASDVELAPLSTYSGKYAGYAIERGKLSVEVRYKIDPGGKLDASHQVVLNQLTFGERVESPSATKLPVRLAVALLKDRHGVIDVNLPVGGSLEDPQFSVGPIIWQVIGNLIAKAATAPFALLSGGGGPDLSMVEFVPGTADMAASAAVVIDKVAKALDDRPALKMTVVGESDIDAEAEAYRRASVEQRLQQELRREQLRASGAAPAAGSGPAAALSAEDRARLVKVVYRETDLPDKPRNLIGLKADIPPAEMEALLQGNVKASPEAMRELALQRGLAVRDALIAKGLPGERMFVGAPKVNATGSGATDKAWTPQVRLSLDTR